MDKAQYIAEGISDYLNEHELSLPLEHVNALAATLESGLDEWRYYSGEHVADQNWHANDRKEHEQKGRASVLNAVEELMISMDGNSRFFDFMSHDQKMALATLGNLRTHLRKQANHDNQ